MPDLLSITAGVVGITVPALHGIRLLLEDLEQFKNASKTVKRLLEDVQSVDTSLAQIASTCRGERMGPSWRKRSGGVQDND